MAIVKTTNSDYVIQTLNSTSNITLNSETVRVLGNLVVLGNTTSVSTTNTDISDNVLRLNVGEIGAGVTQGFSGIGIDRGSLGNVALIFNEAVDKWQITTDGTNFSNIQAFTGNTTGITALIEDLTPTLGGNLNTSIYSITSTNSYVKFAGNLQLAHNSIAPASVAGTTVFYANTPQEGQAGIYIVNSVSPNEELITKKRAFGYSLIL